MEIVLYFWPWLAGLFALVAVLLGLSYKWNWAADALAGAGGALVGVPSGILLGFLLLLAMRVAGFSAWLASRAAENNSAVTTGVIIGALVINGAAIGGGIVGCMLGVGFWRLRRWRLARNADATPLVAGPN